MLNPDELEPSRPATKPVDLQQMSIGELRNYIVSLEVEIERTRDMIAKKEAHRNGIDGLFKTS